jgi:hypothetical protein
VSRCFVIGPIGDRLAPFGSDRRERYEEALQVYEHVILPACAANDLEVIRADGIARVGEITEQIFRHLAEDEVVIADVSGGNPNVMYELGLRHTTGLLTIQIGEYGQLPFDVNTIRTIQFSRSDRGLIDARKQLESALAVGLAEGGDPVTATRILQSASRPVVGQLPPGEEANTESGMKGVGEVPDLDSAGFLDRMDSLETTFPKMTEEIEEIGSILTRLAGEAQSSAEELQLANSGSATAATRLTAIKRFSDVMQPHADSLTQRTATFAQHMKSIDPDVVGILDYVEENADDVLLQADSFLTTLIELGSSSREGMEGLNQFGGVVRDLGKISKLLRRPGQQMAQAIDTMAGATALMDEWEARAQRLRSRLMAEGNANEE